MGKIGARVGQWWASISPARGATVAMANPASASPTPANAPAFPSKHAYAQPPQTPFGGVLRWCHEHPYKGALIGIGIAVAALGFFYCGGMVAVAAAGIALTGQGMIGTGGLIIGITVAAVAILGLIGVLRGAAMSLLALAPLLHIGLSIGLGLIAGGISMCVVSAALGAFGTVAMFIGGGLGVVAGFLIAQAVLRVYVEGREEVSLWLPRQTVPAAATAPNPSPASVAGTPVASVKPAPTLASGGGTSLFPPPIPAAYHPIPRVQAGHAMSSISRRPPTPVPTPEFLEAEWVADPARVARPKRLSWKSRQGA